MAGLQAGGPASPGLGEGRRRGAKGGVAAHAYAYAYAYASRTGVRLGATAQLFDQDMVHLEACLEPVPGDPYSHYR